MTEKDYQKTVAMLIELGESMYDYAHSKDYLEDYIMLPLEENFQNVCIWNQYYHGDTLHNHEHETPDYTIETLTKKYGFSDYTDMLRYIHDNVEIQTCRGSEYYRVGCNEVEFGFYPDPEYFSTIDRFDNSGLYDLLLTATDEQLEQFSRDTDLLVEKQTYGKDISFEACLYLGGAIVVSCSLTDAIQVLENRSK